MKGPAWLAALEWQSETEWHRGRWLIRAQFVDAHTLKVTIFRCGASLASEMATVKHEGPAALARDTRALVAVALATAEKRLRWIAASLVPAFPKRFTRRASR